MEVHEFLLGIRDFLAGIEEKPALVVYSFVGLLSITRLCGDLFPLMSAFLLSVWACACSGHAK